MFKFCKLNLQVDAQYSKRTSLVVVLITVFWSWTNTSAFVAFSCLSFFYILSHNILSKIDIPNSHHIIQCAAKKVSPMEVFLPFSKQPLGIFMWNFTCLLPVHIHIKNTKRHLVAFNCCKVTEFCVWPPSDFCTFKNLRTPKRLH